MLQIHGEECLIVGGEDTPMQAERVARRFRGATRARLRAELEAAIAPVLSTAAITHRDPAVQAVVDLNRRVVYSGIDAGGACFGALNRIYHLIWVRDGSMTTAMMARAGMPQLLQTWAPFVLANPSPMPDGAGGRVGEWLQLLGTRWTKSEDDGIYYAALSLFTLYETTGDQGLLHASVIDPLLASLDHNLLTRLDPRYGLFVSDTRGETTLASSRFFGFDTVNGRMEYEESSLKSHGRVVWRAGTLYHNVNLYNVLRMAACLLHEAGRAPRAREYSRRADELAAAIRTRFVRDGIFMSDLAVFEDGSEAWTPFAQGDYWEYAWAVSVGPFFPDLPVALASARMCRRDWPGIKAYGYCPWNTLARTLKEHGMPSAEYDAMLADEIREARTVSTKYPMVGALTEYFNWVEGWRALPFSAGSLMFSLAGLLLQSLPRGIAVRASDLVDRIDRFRFRASSLDVVAEGSGDGVADWRLNGHHMRWTLQVPELSLRAGRNEVLVTRGARPTGPRW